MVSGAGPTAGHCVTKSGICLVSHVRACAYAGRGPDIGAIELRAA